MYDISVMVLGFSIGLLIGVYIVYLCFPDMQHLFRSRRMKLKISPGWWIVYCGIIDVWVGAFNIHYHWFLTEYLSAAFCVIVSLPLWIPPIGKWVGVRSFWS